MNQTTYSISFHISDAACDSRTYFDIDDAYDAAELYSARNREIVNIYEDGVHFATVRNYA